MNGAGNNSIWLGFDAVDTWMFRDGRPFDQGDAGASVARSVFPPFPPTLVGAVRAMLWRQTLGGKWDTSKLGDGTNWQQVKQDRQDEKVLGPLLFGPPLVLHNGQPVFPVPLHLVEGKVKGRDEKRLTFLRPRKNSFKSDLGDKVQLLAPVEDLEGIKTISDRWVTQEGMERILNGKVPDKDQLIPTGKLWNTESRVGISIDPGTRVVRESQLYMASHVRLCENVRLAVEMQGWNAEVPNGLTPVAGEHRMAEVQALEKEIVLPEPVTPEKDGQIVLIAISPVAPDDKGNIPGLPGDKLMSACTGRPVPIGGWDSRAHAAIPLRRCWPAGSVWFLEGFEGEPPSAIGMATEWGFGRVLVGRWPHDGQ